MLYGVQSVRCAVHSVECTEYNLQCPVNIVDWSSVVEGGLDLFWPAVDVGQGRHLGVTVQGRSGK